MSDQRLRQEQIEAIQEAQTILVNHLDCPPSLKTLAQQVNLNERQLKEGFRQLFGTSVFQYLYEQRMARSRQLLIETDMNVTEVAHHVGYRSIPSFSKAFRRKFGISPRHYQQKSPV
jgi:AraC-like DNA-binding protein